MNPLKCLFLFAIFLINQQVFAEESNKTLTVYTNASFAASLLEEGNQLKLSFEQKCNCNLNFIALDSGGTMLSRLLFEGKKNKADVILGLDTALIVQAEKSGLFAEHKVNTDKLDLPIKWHNKYFVPFDYGYFAFVYDSQKLKNPPTSLDELINREDKIKILIQDPRSETVGLSFLLWMRTVYGENAKVMWHKLFKKVVTFTKGWGESYALFLKGEADMVMSYSTSPAYHLMIERRGNIKAVEFAEGNFMQVEVMAKLKNSPNQELADLFLEFMISYDAQMQIPRANYMYPVLNLGNDMPVEYLQVPKPKRALYMLPEEVDKVKNRWVQEWLDSMSRN